MNTRREFIGAVGAGVLVTLSAQDQHPAPRDVSAWLHIAGDGAVTVYTGKIETGQNTRTALTAAVAEELHAPVESIRMIMGDTDLTPYDGGTYGSQSTPVMSPQLRRAAATAPPPAPSPTAPPPESGPPGASGPPVPATTRTRRPVGSEMRPAPPSSGS